MTTLKSAARPAKAMGSTAVVTEAVHLKAQMY